MGTINDKTQTDGEDDVLAVLYNNLLGSIFRSEFSNVETLAATRVLLDADYAIQRFNCNGADRIAKMPTADVDNNHPYLLVNSTSSGTWKLTVQNNGATVTYAALNPSEYILMIPDGVGGYLPVNHSFWNGVSPSQITANQNNYNPTGASSANVLRLSTDAARDVTGFGFPAANKTILVHNVGTNNLVLKDESASSTAANRFALNADVTLGADQSVMLWYDTTSSRWRLVGGAGGSSSGGGLPAGYLYGLTLTNNATDATNDIDIAVGKCRDSTDAEDIALASGLTKRLDATWAVGTNQGGLDTGTVANGTYHIWLIKRSDTGVVDVLFSTSATSPTMPTNYDYKRRIGSIMRANISGTDQIRPFVQDGDRFMWKTPVQDVNVTNPGTSAVTRTLTVPTGIRVKAMLHLYGGGTAASDLPRAVYISDLSLSDIALVAGEKAFSLYAYVNATTSGLGGYAEAMTNTSAEVRSRVQVSTAATYLIINTAGWLDTRDSGNTGGGGGGGGALSDGDYGDITVGGSGTTMTIDPGAVTLAKLVDATAQYRLLGRLSASAGDFEEITSSANVFSLLQAADYAAMRTLLGLVIGTNVQAYDADLTTWAGLTPSANAQSLVTAADYAAMRTLLGLVIGTNVQAYDADLTTWAGKTAPSGTVLGTTDTQTLTNKRVTPRVGTVTSSATPTINTDNVDVFTITAQTVDITSMTTNLSGTPTDGQKLLISITGTATRAITWGASFEASTIALPTTTSGTNRLDVGFIWNAATSKWRCVGYV